MLCVLVPSFKFSRFLVASNTAGLGRVQPVLPLCTPCQGHDSETGIWLLEKASRGRHPRVPTHAPREEAELALPYTRAPGVTGNGMDAGCVQSTAPAKQDMVMLRKVFLKQKVYPYSKYMRCPKRRLCFLINRLASAEMKAQN